MQQPTVSNCYLRFLWGMQANSAPDIRQRGRATPGLIEHGPMISFPPNKHALEPPKTVMLLTTAHRNYTHNYCHQDAVSLWTKVSSEFLHCRNVRQFIMMTCAATPRHRRHRRRRRTAPATRWMIRWVQESRVRMLGRGRPPNRR